MAKQYLVRGLSICISGSKPPAPIRSQHPTSTKHIFQPTYILPMCALPCLFDGQATPSVFAWYLHQGVKHIHPCPILVSRPSTTATHILYLHQLIYFICDSCHAFLMAKGYQAHSFGICFSGSKLPTPTQSQHPSIPPPLHTY